jgi:hypothetical protein
MSAENDLAFPSSRVILGKTVNSDGMSLRDYFAAKALQGLVANPSHTLEDQEYSEAAYMLADAMLESRE